MHEGKVLVDDARGVPQMVVSAPRAWARSGRSVNDLTTGEMDHYWDAAKRVEAADPAAATAPLTSPTEPSQTPR